MSNPNTFEPTMGPDDYNAIAHQQDSVVSETPTQGPNDKFGTTSDYNGYGTDEKGYDIERNDLGPDYYNTQARRGTEALYAAAEDELAAENKAFEDAWNEEAAEKEMRDSERIQQTLVNLRADVNSAIDNAIAHLQKTGATQEHNKGTDTTANTADIPTLDNTAAEGATATISNANASDNSNANIQTPNNTGGEEPE